MTNHAAGKAVEKQSRRNSSDGVEQKMTKLIRKTRYTVVEVIIAIAITAILMAMFVPVYKLITM